MKNIIIRLSLISAALIILSKCVWAVSPSTTISMIWGEKVNVTSTNVTNSKTNSQNAFDTLGATDSVSLFSSFMPEPGWEYVIQMATLTGTAVDGSGTDSLVSAIYLQSIDGATIIQTDSITISSIPANLCVIPFNGSKGLSPSGKYNIKFKTLTGTGTQVIVNRFYIFRRRSVLPGFVNVH